MYVCVNFPMILCKGFIFETISFSVGLIELLDIPVCWRHLYVFYDPALREIRWGLTPPPQEAMRHKTCLVYPLGDSRAKKERTMKLLPPFILYCFWQCYLAIVNRSSLPDNDNAIPQRFEQKSKWCENKSEALFENLSNSLSLWLKRVIVTSSKEMRFRFCE